LARRSQAGEEPRSTSLAVRLTPSERALIEQRAAAAGLSASGYLATLIRNRGRSTIEPRDTLDPMRMAELNRIGRSIVDLAEAVRSGQLPEPARTIEAMRDLMTWLLRDEITRRRLQAYESERRDDGSPNASPRHEFQRRVGLSPAR